MSLPTPPSPLYETLRLSRLPDMRTLDRSAFILRQPIIAVRVDVAKLSRVRTDPRLRGWMMDWSKARLVLDDKEGDGSTKLLRLKVSREEELPQSVREFLLQEARGYVQDELVVDYDMWTASDVLNSILPAGEAGDMAPSAFTTTGHIGHVNLKEAWLPYKTLIGQVFLDASCAWVAQRLRTDEQKNPNLRTIVNKLDSIHAEFRYFDMEVLAGEPDFVTSLSESGCTFTFDFSKVYWNSRLQHEHDRLIDLLPVGSVVADVMAGVGPFAVPAAKKGCYVLGNDLNPESVRWMRENQAKNKVEKTLRVTELDGKAFIQQSARMAWDEPFEPFVPPSVLRKRAAEARRLRDLAAKMADTHVSDPKTAAPSAPSTSSTLPLNEAESQATVGAPRLLPQHYIMNLPDSALTFLGAFNGLYDSFAGDEAFEAKLDEIGLPLVHVYCFTRELELLTATKDICERASQYLGHTITPESDAYGLHLVRRVAPNKDMYCLTFRLPRDVAFTSSAA